MRDPYGIYARHVLNLRALDPLDADPGAADYGSLVHDALEQFIRAYPGDLPEDACNRLIDIGREVFDEHLAQPGVWAFWWPRFERIAKWFVEQETKRRGRVQEMHVEVTGQTELEGPAGPFILRAKADRIDLLRDGSLAILDYKTGAPPSAREVAAGFAPQLPLEAVIARRGGFPGIAAGKKVSELLYWRLKGGDAGWRGTGGPQGHPTRPACSRGSGRAGRVDPRVRRPRHAL